MIFLIEGLLLLVAIGALLYCYRFAQGRRILIEIGYFVLGSLFSYLFILASTAVIRSVQMLNNKATALLGGINFTVSIILPIILIVFLWRRKRSIAIGLMVMGIIVFPLGCNINQIVINDGQYQGAEQTISKLEQYKKEKNGYPKNISAIGLKIDEHLISYHANGESYCLCFDYYVGDLSLEPHGFYPDGICYDSSVKKWQDFVRSMETQCK